ncbi:MAG: hypothetical protein ABL958_11705 [Bdellovibrionia bacterium]
MKNFLAALAVLVAVSSAQAALSDFTGKYSLRNCSFEGSRAYVGYKRNKVGNTTGLQINVYGEDAAILELDLQGSSTENPNFKLGNPIQSVLVVVQFDGQKLVNRTVHVYATGAKKLASTEALSLTKSGLSYVKSDEFHKMSEQCTFVRE